MRLFRSSLSAAMAAVAITAFAAQAGAAPSAKALADSYVALGDSYSSGVGTGTYYSDSGSCKRSPAAYPALWAKAHGASSFSFAACSGARTGDVLNNQLGSLSASTTLVTISVGGNDAGFSDVITDCTLGSDSDCIDRVDEAKTFARNQLPAKLDSVYSAIRSRAASAKVVVLGYPRLYKVPGSCSVGLSDTKRSAINGGSDTLAQVISGRAAAAGFTFVDMRTPFTGHEICSSSWWLNSLTWPIEESYHPNKNGQSQGYLPALNGVTG